MSEALPEKATSAVDRLPASGVSIPQELMAAMSDPKVDPDKLEKMLDFVERGQSISDKRAYSDAMSAVQRDVPVVVKDATNRQTNSKYPKVESLNKALKPVYTEHNLRISFGQAESSRDGFTRWTARVSYGLHSEDYYVDLPPDDKGIKGSVNKTMVHAIKSSSSYAQGILLARIFNITIADHDNDGNGGREIVTPKQAAFLKELISEKSADPKAYMQDFLAWANCGSLETFPADKYNAAVNNLESL
jgi:hypothetical protein